MTYDKWTYALAAAGLIGAPAFSASADEAPSTLLTKVSSTAISGYVNTSMHWNTGTGNGFVPPVLYNTPTKQDGFNLNVVDLQIEKPLDESTWAAGYKAEIWFGEDAGVFGSNSSIGRGGSRDDFAIRQGYVALRVPVGNGLDVKAGVFDSIVGYESHDSGENPNYTRAYSISLEPYNHTGLLMSYQLCPLASASAGIANTVGPIINQKANPPKAEAHKTYMGALTVNAPEDWGFLSGSALFVGVVNGFNSRRDWDETLWYAGVTLNTPFKALRVGASYDYLGTTEEFSGDDNYANALAVYASLELSSKISVHGRGEYAWTDTAWLGGPADLAGGNSEVFALTGTVQFDLWQNVISRVEVRWDHLAGDGGMKRFGGSIDGFGGGGFGDAGSGSLAASGSGSRRNNVLIAANIIYVF